MRHLVPFMQAVLNRPVGRTIVATDAEGNNDVDFGGYGAVAAQVRSELAEEALRVGTRAGRVVAKLDGSIAKWVSGERELKRCIGVSKLPRELINAGQQQWCEVTKGRWRWAEHIMLGEGRAAVKLMGLVATFPGARGHCVLLLEVNEPFSAAASKGRSPTHRVNVILRKRTAQELVADLEFVVPWLDSASQPADDASRARE